MDMAAQQNNDMVRSLMAAQEMQSSRVAELGAEKEALSTELSKLKHELSEAVEREIEVRATAFAHLVPGHGYWCAGICVRRHTRACSRAVLLPQ